MYANVSIIFPQKSGSERIRYVDTFYIPNGFNGDGELDDFTESSDSVPNNNLGVITLNKPIKIDGSKWKIIKNLNILQKIKFYRNSSNCKGRNRWRRYRTFNKTQWKIQF